MRHLLQPLFLIFCLSVIVAQGETPAAKPTPTPLEQALNAAAESLNNKNLVTAEAKIAEAEKLGANDKNFLNLKACLYIEKRSMTRP
jgi:hypothetical protein